jgi:VIT1/CCC1 family predicted Fe2+/Mn2+ transporter
MSLYEAIILLTTVYHENARTNSQLELIAKLDSRGIQAYNITMSKHITIFLLGAFVAMLPFLGFPSSWDKVFLVASGSFVSLGAILIRSDIVRVKRANSQNTSSFGPAFVDSANVAAKNKRAP